jgi:hypothetical protein
MVEDTTEHISIYHNTLIDNILSEFMTLHYIKLKLNQNKLQLLLNVSDIQGQEVHN